MSITEEVRKILGEHGRLTSNAGTLSEEADLYREGLTSHATVNLMLALEARFDIEFPDAMLKHGVFRSIAGIRDAVEKLTSQSA